jgi:hypothetical protein
VARWRKRSGFRWRIRRPLKCSSSTVDTSRKTLEVLVNNRNCELSRKARNKSVSNYVNQTFFTGMIKGNVPVEDEILEVIEPRGVVPSDRSSFGSNGNIGWGRGGRRQKLAKRTGWEKVLAICS